MKKKALCGLLTAAVLMGTCPTAAFAADTVTLTESLDFRTMTEDASGAGWKWNADKQKLTLDGFRVSVPYDKLEGKAVIYLPEESRIEVEGKDNLISSQAFRCHAIYCEGDLNIDGDGVLEIKTGSYSSSAFYLINGPLMLDEEVEIKVDPEGYVVYVDEAKGSRPILSIQDEAMIRFPEKKAEDRSIFITHTHKVTPKDNWLDYAEEFDDWDDTIMLVAKKADTAADAEEKTDAADTPIAEETPAVPEEPAVNEYQITIGKTDITKNGEVSYTADVSPYLKNGYTMLPLRALLEVSNPEQKVNWNNGTKSAHTFVNNRLVSIKPGEATYTKALETIELYTPAETVNGRLVVSLRDWMSIMEIDVSQLKWDATTKTVTLKY